MSDSIIFPKVYICLKTNNIDSGVFAEQGGKVVPAVETVFPFKMDVVQELRILHDQVGNHILFKHTDIKVLNFVPQHLQVMLLLNISVDK